MRNLTFVDRLVNGTKVIVVDVTPRLVTVRKENKENIKLLLKFFLSRFGNLCSSMNFYLLIGFGLQAWPFFCFSGRSQRILSLVSRANADSEASDGNSSEDEIRGSFESSPPPSLNSSLERLNLLESPEPYAVYYDDEEPNISTDDHQGQRNDTSGEMPPTSVLQKVLPSPSQIDIYAVPSLSLLLSVPSNPNSPRTPEVTNTRSQK